MQWGCIVIQSNVFIIFFKFINYTLILLHLHLTVGCFIFISFYNNKICGYNKNLCILLGRNKKREKNSRFTDAKYELMEKKETTQLKIRPNDKCELSQLDSLLFNWVQINFIPTQPHLIAHTHTSFMIHLVFIIQKYRRILTHTRALKYRTLALLAPFLVHPLDYTLT